MSLYAIRGYLALARARARAREALEDSALEIIRG